MDTSIVIATCSRVALLRGAVESLLQQTWAQTHSVELVIVDDRSTDGTATYLTDLRRHSGFPLQVIVGPARGIAAARNAGFAAARGAWIASFDDDQIAVPHWLEALRVRADRSRAACVGGVLTLALPDGVALGSLGSRVRSLLGEHLPYGTARPYADPFHPATNNALLRRDILGTADVFDTHFTEGGEDKELFSRLRADGHTLWFEPRAVAAHLTPASRLEEANLRWTARRIGASDARAALLRGRSHALRLLGRRITLALARDLACLLCRRGPARLDACCSLWYTEGLLKGGIALCLPRSTPGRSFLHSLNFRQRNGERSETPAA